MKKGPRHYMLLGALSYRSNSPATPSWLPMTPTASAAIPPSTVI